MKDTHAPVAVPARRSRLVPAAVMAPFLAALAAACFGWERAACFFSGAPIGVLAVSAALAAERKLGS